ncbi:multimerin-2-like [Crassostrea virginica]
MWTRITLGFLFLTQTNSLSLLTDGDPQNITSVDKSGDSNTDVFRQLLNQETLIRMTMDRKVQGILKDIIEMKSDLATNAKQLSDAEKEIITLRNEVRSLKTENQALQAETQKFKQVISQFENKFRDIDENFTDFAWDQEKHEINWNRKIERFQENTSKILDDIKIEVRYLSVTLLDLNKHTMELNSIPSLVDDKFTRYSANLNTSMVEMNHMLLSTKDFQDNVVYNLSALEKDQSRIKILLSETLNSTINTIKSEVEQSQNAHLKLSSAVSSLEVFRINMSLFNICAKETREGFNVGVTSSGSTWAGDILVFPHVITNNGNGYDPSTGKFTASKKGTYVFSANVNAYGSNTVYLEIVHNGMSKVRTMAYGSTSHQTGTNMAVLVLEKGDSVWVKRYSGQGYYTDSVPITTFSGFLL